MKLDKAIEELRKSEKRKFIQTVDLIVNLQNFDARKEQVNTFIKIPNPPQKKICAFLTKKTKLVDTITEDDFSKYKEPKQIKNLAKKYDFFIAVAPMMGKVATKFGRYLGPLGKMPNPQVGIMNVDNDENIKETVKKVSEVLRVRTKEKSVKIAIGKEDMSDEDLTKNINTFLKGLENALPNKKENIKDVMIKFTMTKPVKVDY